MQGSERKVYLLFFHWLVTYGRFIIIIVELVVLSAFGLRFSYDTQLADLKDNIKRQSIALESYYIDEPRIRVFQKKLEFIKKNYDVNPTWEEIFTQVSSEIPLTVKLTSLSLEQDPTLANPTLQLRLAAQTNSINDLGFFLKNLRSNKKFNEVTLQNIAIEQGQIIFNIGGSVAK